MRLGYCSSSPLFYVICGVRIWRKALYSLYIKCPMQPEGSFSWWFADQVGSTKYTQQDLSNVDFFIQCIYIYDIQLVGWDSLGLLCREHGTKVCDKYLESNGNQ
jgi:hypothetical protein